MSVYGKGQAIRLIHFKMNRRGTRRLFEDEFEFGNFSYVKRLLCLTLEVRGLHEQKLRDLFVQGRLNHAEKLIHRVRAGECLG